MIIDTFLTPENIAVAAEVTSKKRLLELLSQLIAATEPALNQKILFEALMDRERLGTTAMGQGVAIPHGRIAHLEHAVGGFVQLKNGINFDAPDKQPVDLVFGLLVPEAATQEHLELLSAIAQQFNNPAHCDALRAAKDRITLLKLLAG